MKLTKTVIDQLEYDREPVTNTKGKTVYPQLIVWDGDRNEAKQIPTSLGIVSSWCSSRHTSQLRIPFAIKGVAHLRHANNAVKSLSCDAYIV
jgi:hypothetical protein